MHALRLTVPCCKLFGIVCKAFCEFISLWYKKLFCLKKHSSVTICLNYILHLLLKSLSFTLGTNDKVKNIVYFKVQLSSCNGVPTASRRCIELREAHLLLEQLNKKTQGSRSAVFPANTVPLPPWKRCYAYQTCATLW